MKKFMSVFFLVFFSFIAVQANAFQISHEQGRLSDGRMAISITVSSAPSDEISLSVYRSDMSPDEQEVTADNASQIFVYANQKTANEQGMARFIIQSGSRIEDGEYRYKAYSGSNGAFLESGFRYYSKESIDAVLSELYGLRDEPEDAEAFVEENSDMLQIHTPLYLKFAERGQTPAQAVAAVLGTLYTFDTIEEFKSVFYDHLCRDAIICLRDYDDMLLLYNDSSAISIVNEIGLGSAGTQQATLRYTSFTKMDKASKIRVFEKINDINPSTPETLIAAFSEAVFMTEWDGAVNWEMIDRLISDNDDLLASSPEYLALSSKKRAPISQALYKVKNLATTEEVSSKLAALLKSGAESTGSAPRISSGGTGLGSIKLSESPEKPPTAAAAPPKAAFSDLKDAAWAKDAIEVLLAGGAISGRSDTVFAPNDYVTREEFVKMASELFGFTGVGASCDFEDVTKQDWFYPYVATARKMGLVNGVSQTLFGSGAALSRQDLAAFAYRFAVAAGVDFASEAAYIPFYDHSLTADYAIEAMEALTRRGIINGKNGNVFAPWDNCTRAETAQILYGIYKLL